MGSTTTFYNRLYAIDISTGANHRPGPSSCVEIQGSSLGKGSPNDGKGNIVFNPQWQMNRPALLLLNGRIYIGFGAHCDNSASLYHGWVLAYDATTLQQVGVFCTTPDSDPTSVGGDTPFDMGGVWQSGMGLAADPQNFIYFITGNGLFDANVPPDELWRYDVETARHLHGASPTVPADLRRRTRVPWRVEISISGREDH